MKRAILSALLTSAALSATNITGVVRDAKGSPIPDADVTVTNPDTGVTKHTISGAGGEFTLEIESTSPVIVRAEKAGQPLADYRIDAAVDGEKSVRIGGRIAEANLIKKVNPVYPPEAKAEGVEGTVTIGCTISTQGVPSELYIMSSDSDALSQSALDAVRQWRYKPTLLNGNPVAVQTVITVNYTLAK